MRSPASMKRQQNNGSCGDGLGNPMVQTSPSPHGNLIERLCSGGPGEFVLPRITHQTDSGLWEKAGDVVIIT